MVETPRFMPLAKTRSSLLKDVLRELAYERKLNRDPTSSDFESGYQQALQDVYERMEK